MLDSAPASHPQTTPLVELPETSRRQDTVATLATLLGETTVVHIRGTPASGKTTLARLLEANLLASNTKVVFITGWNQQRDVVDVLSEKCLRCGYESLDSLRALQLSEYTFILDEAQESYPDPTEFLEGEKDLWGLVLKQQSMRGIGPRFALFTSYGSPTGGTPYYPKTRTPVILTPRQRVSLKISGFPDSPQISLCYTVSEHIEAVQRFCGLQNHNFSFDENAGQYIYNLTNGHPGLVNSLLLYVFNVSELLPRYTVTKQKDSLRQAFQQDIKKDGEVTLLSLDNVINVVYDRERLFQYIRFLPAGRSFPHIFPSNVEVLSPASLGVLLKVLADGWVEFEPTNEPIGVCFRNGWVQVEHVLSGRMVCTFPTRLHAG